MRIVRRTAVLILLGLTLGMPWAEASPYHVLDYLGGILTSLWLKGGCTMDPLGRCVAGTQAHHTDGGCTMDPDGSCAPRLQTQSTDGGCTIDPDGRCAPDH
jgi:hypothetical protein